MCDISETAVRYSKINAELNQIKNIDIKISDGYNNIMDRDFTIILSNPPYHTDFFVANKFIEDGYKRLVIGGRMVMVTKRLAWYKNKLSSVFGGVMVHEINGYYVFIAEKRRNKNHKPTNNRKKMSKKLERKYGNMNSNNLYSNSLKILTIHSIYFQLEIVYLAENLPLPFLLSLCG